MTQYSLLLIAVLLIAVSSNDDKNVFNEELEECCRDPVTGYYRNGYCVTGPSDYGKHVVCVTVTAAFLEHSIEVGNDLSTPHPQYRFPGLKPGNCWCLCASRWKEAMEQGVAPPINLQATHRRMLDFVPLETLMAYNNVTQSQSRESNTTNGYFFVDR